MKTLALLATLLLSPLAYAGDLNWSQIYETEGIKVSRADVEDSKLYAFKGETVMDAEIGRVLYVLLDNEHRLEWVGRLAKNEVLQQNNDFDYIIYQVFDLPAVFADRDYVYHGVATRDESTGVVTLSMQSTTHPKAPETVGVRAELINSRYTLTPMGADKTKVVVEIITDPKGMMPAWLVNLIQKDWPVDTLGGVKGQLNKPFTGVHKLPGETDEVEEDTAAEEPTEAEGEATEETTEEGSEETTEGGSEEGGEEAGGGTTGTPGSETIEE